MKRNPPDYYDDLQQLYYGNEMGKRSSMDNILQHQNGQKMRNQLQRLARMEKRRRQKSKQQKLAEQYYSSIF